MHDALLVGGDERVGERLRQIEDLWEGKTARNERAVQTLAVDEFHGQEVNALHFFDPKFNGVDWNAARQRFAPREVPKASSSKTRRSPSRPSCSSWLVPKPPNA